MEIIRLMIQILTTVSGCLAALLSIPVFLRRHWPASELWIVKLFPSALSPLFASVGVLRIIVGLTSGSVFISLIGVYENFDIYLPNWLAKNNKAIYSAFLIIFICGLVYRLLNF